MGVRRAYHDGAGLTSPGRWPPDRRVFPEGLGLEVLIQKLEGLRVKKTGIDKVFKSAFILVYTSATCLLLGRVDRRGQDHHLAFWISCPRLPTTWRFKEAALEESRKDAVYFISWLITSALFGSHVWRG